MQRFFVTPGQVGEQEIYIEGSDVNHMKNVLRLKTGEEVMVKRRDNRQYRCAVKEYPAGRAVLEILEAGDVDTELPSKIYLFQGLPKQDKMELIVQKAVELGVCQVIPVETKRCVVKLDDKKGGKKGTAVAADRRERGKAGRERLYPESIGRDAVSFGAGTCRGAGCLSDPI